MASFISQLLLTSFSLFLMLHVSLATTRHLSALVKDQQTQLLKYHNGALLSGKISVNLIWYGRFNPSQRAIVSDFITSLSSSKPTTNINLNQPSVSTWWKTTDKYYSKKPSLFLYLGKQSLDQSYSMGKSLTSKQIVQLASKGEQQNAINILLTSSDVIVEGFCTRCGTHGSSSSKATRKIGQRNPKFAYIWVGNSEAQCPGQCAWPFYKPIYGPQTEPLVSPNADIGMDGIVINLASLLANTATNPFGNGYYQGSAEAPLEAVSACPGIYGTGAYPGYPGNLLADSITGASYNAIGDNGRKFLVPAMYDPSTSSCSTLV